MTRKVQIEAGRDASVDQSVGKEAVMVEKTSFVQSVLSDKARLAILAALGCFVSEVVAVIVLAVCKVIIPNDLWELMRLTLMLSGAVWGAQRLNGKISQG